MSRPWSFLPHDQAAIVQLTRQLRISPLVAQVLVARGHDSVDAARSFLDPKLTNLLEPSLLLQIDYTQERNSVPHRQYDARSLARFHVNQP